jgi:hypothetical protein
MNDSGLNEARARGRFSEKISAVNGIPERLMAT